MGTPGLARKREVEATEGNLGESPLKGNGPDMHSSFLPGMKMKWQGGSSLFETSRSQPGGQKLWTEVSES